MSKSKPKTEGLEWLVHSLMAFNGTGYADMDSPQDYLASYRAYKTNKKDKNAVSLSRIYELEVLPIITNLLEKTNGAGRVPLQKNLDKVRAVQHQQESQTFLL